MTKLRQQFEAIDINKDGKISFEEIEILISKHLGEKDQLLLFSILRNMIDIDQSGTIDYFEFLSLCTKHQDALTIDNLTKAFHSLDRDGDGKLTIVELREAFEAGGGRNHHRSQSFWERYIEKFDKDSDKQISLDEFINYMR